MGVSSPVSAGAWNRPLLHYDNVIITPHIAFYSREAVQRILDTTITNICCFLAGESQNMVAGGAGA